MSAAKKQQYFEEHGIRWKIIPPRAAWLGVWWERMVAKTNRCLLKVLGRAQVDEEELQTILVGIEATIYSRPIIKNDDNLTLRAAHLLTGVKLMTIPNRPEHVRTEILTRSFRQHHRFSEAFGDAGKGNISYN